MLWDSAAALVQNHEYPVDSHAVLKLVAKYSVSAYDAEYVVLAEDLQVPLVTFDQKLQAAVPKVAFSADKFLKA